MTDLPTDHATIQRLMYRYARCADRQDYAGFGEVFTDDAVFEFQDREARGIDAIRDMMLALEKYSVTLHQVQNVLYDIDGDSARGETYCLASHLLQADGATEKLDMGIIYRDTLSRTAKGWRIAHRCLDLLWVQRSAVENI